MFDETWCLHWHKYGDFDDDVDFSFSGPEISFLSKHDKKSELSVECKNWYLGYFEFAEWKPFLDKFVSKWQNCLIKMALGA